MIALALLAPDGVRPRSYLADMLWSDRGRTQALGSLRRAISEARAALGDLDDCLIADRTLFGFRPGTVVTDLSGKG